LGEWLTGGSKVGAAMGGVGGGLLWLGGDGEDQYAEQKTECIGTKEKETTERND
jgi:hypothetical protein